MCAEAAQTFKYNFNNITERITTMYKNETEKREAFRDILHIIEKLPQDFEGC